MLKGLVIAASGTRVLKEELDRTHFPWTEAGGREAEGFQKAARKASCEAGGASVPC